MIASLEIFRENIRRGLKICVYGLGRLYSEGAEQILDILGVQPDFYCDKNEKRLDALPIDKRKKLPFCELIQYEFPIYVLLFLGNRYVSESREELKKNKNIIVISYFDMWEILGSDDVLKEYFRIDAFPTQFLNDDRMHYDIFCSEDANISTGDVRVAVYSCITNGYDRPQRHSVIDNGFDYYLITDEKIDYGINIENYKLISVFDLCPDYIRSPKDMNRYCKIHGRDLFPEYDYCVYVDGNVCIVGDLKDLIGKIGKTGIAVHSNPFPDVYLEVMSLVIRGRIHYDEAKITVKTLVDAGLPRYRKYPECTIVMYDNKIDSSELTRRWFNNYMKLPAKRDQPSLALALWEMGIDPSELCVLPGNLRTNGYFALDYNNQHAGYQV